MGLFSHLYQGGGGKKQPGPPNPWLEGAIGRLGLFRKALELTGCMESQDVRARKATKGHKAGNPRPQRCKPRQSQALDADAQRAGPESLKRQKGPTEFSGFSKVRF